MASLEDPPPLPSVGWMQQFPPSALADDPDEQLEPLDHAVFIGPCSRLLRQRQPHSSTTMSS